MKLPPLDYVSPRSIDEVIQLLHQHEAGAKILSGGQSLMPMLAFRLASCSLLIDLKHVPELNYIVIDDAGIELGAKVRWRDIEQDQRLHRSRHLLGAAVQHIAHYQIRNRGTVGGSLAHADPAAELPAVAVTCDAQIIAIGPEGRRSIPASKFFLAPLVTALEPCEMIVAIRLPPWPPHRRFGFEEFARRRGDFALAGAAIFFDEDDQGRIRDPHVGAFGVADTPIRLHKAEEALAGALLDERIFADAARLGTEDIDARTDIHAEGDYRRSLLKSLIERALLAAQRTKK